MQLCKRQEDQIECIVTAFEKTELTPLQKSSLGARYRFLLQSYRSRARRYNCAYHSLRVTITIGSLIVPALLSVQYTGSVPTSDQVYWIVWVLSLCVTISNGIVTLLKVDKKYFTLNTTYQLLLSEAWQFIGLSGRFSGFYTPGYEPSHTNQYKYFCHFIEKIRMKQIEDEYYKSPDQGQHAITAESTTTIDPMVPPTPQKNVLKSQVDVNVGPAESTGRQTTVRRQQQALSNSQTGASALHSASAPVLPGIAESEGESRDSE